MSKLALSQREKVLRLPKVMQGKRDPHWLDHMVTYRWNVPFQTSALVIAQSGNVISLIVTNEGLRKGETEMTDPAEEALQYFNA